MQDKSLWEKICDWFKDFAAKLQAVVDAYKGVKPDSVEGKLVANMQDMIVTLESIYAAALVDASENYAGGAKENTAEEGGVRYMIRNGILTVDSTEQERYEYLKEKGHGVKPCPQFLTRIQSASSRRRKGSDMHCLVEPRGIDLHFLLGWGENYGFDAVEPASSNSPPDCCI